MPPPPAEPLEGKLKYTISGEVAAFISFDVNADGFIDIDEFFAISQTLQITAGDNELSDVFAQYDIIDTDGLLSGEEYFGISAIRRNLIETAADMELDLLLTSFRLALKRNVQMRDAISVGGGTRRRGRKQ